GSNESIFQPEWSPGGLLYFVSDRSGWWNLYRRSPQGIEPVCEMPAEFGGPQWMFRMSVYAFASSRKIICAYNELGGWHLGAINTGSHQLKPIATDYTEIASVRTGPGFAVFTGGSPTAATSLVRIDLKTGKAQVLRKSSSVEIDPGYIS